ncbi:radical SAM protein [Phascolarctobacterium sp.]
MQEIVIYLGSKCNLDCPYCHREASEHEAGIADELLNYLKDRECIIAFKGGEPTLYMDDIKKVVAEAAKAKFRISTNAVLLDRYLDYFREHEFEICISYDGETAVRGYDPFTKLINYPWLYVSTTLHHGNTNIEKLLDDLADKSLVVGHYLNFYPHLVHCTNERNKGYALTDEDYNSIADQIKAGILKYLADIVRYGTVNRRYRSLYLMLKGKLECGYSYGETFCANQNTQRVDTAGHRYNCLYIRDVELGADWQEQQKQVIASLASGCADCPVYDMCGAGCVKSLQHDKECAFYRDLYGWFKEFYDRNQDALESVECI